MLFMKNQILSKSQFTQRLSTIVTNKRYKKVFCRWKKTGKTLRIFVELTLALRGKLQFFIFILKVSIIFFSAYFSFLTQIR